MKNKSMSAFQLCLLLFTASGHAAMLTFNSSGTSITVDRNAWLASAGVASPQFFVDFESGFSDEQNISGQSGLFPAGLVVTDTSSAGSAVIEGTAGGLGGSNPIGGFAVRQNEQPYLVLDFSLNPVDYLAFRDIDHTGTTVLVTFVGGATDSFTLETTGASGNSAEFAGIVANDMPQISMIQLDASGDNKWGIDNIEFGGVSAVPIPAAAWLFGSALLGLGVVKRRKA